MAMNEWQVNQAQADLEWRFDSPRIHAPGDQLRSMFDIKHNKTIAIKHYSSAPQIMHPSRLIRLLRGNYAFKISTTVNRKFHRMLPKCNSVNEFDELSGI